MLAGASIPMPAASPMRGGTTHRGARPGGRARRRAHRRAGRSSATPPITSGRGIPKIRDVIDGLVRDLDWNAVDRRPLRRSAPPRRARAAAGRRLGHHRPRRADQPPGRRGHHLARRAPQEALARESGRAPGRHARPVVPGRGVHRDLGGARPDRRAVRGRLRRVHPAARRARPHGRGDRGEAAEPRPQGARLAAPWCTRAHGEAEVPDRRGQRADRRRPGSPRPDRAAVPRRLASRQGGRGPDRRRGDVPFDRLRDRQDRLRGRRRSCATWSGGSHPGSAPGSSASTAQGSPRCSASSRAPWRRPRDGSSTARPCRCAPSRSASTSCRTCGTSRCAW